jgi:hypothetical protein
MVKKQQGMATLNVRILQHKDKKKLKQTGKRSGTNLERSAA